MNIPQGDRVARDNHRVSISRRSVNKVSQGCRRRSGAFHYGQASRIRDVISDWVCCNEGRDETRAKKAKTSGLECS